MNSRNYWQRVSAIALLALTVPVVRAAGVDVVTGTVLDVAGKPVSGARVGAAFRLGPTAKETKTLLGYEPSTVVTDANGAFGVPAAAISYTKALVVLGVDGTLGFVIRDSSSTVRIQLAQSARLDVQLIKNFGSDRPITVELTAEGFPLGYGIVEAGVARFAVPPGVLGLKVSDSETMTVTRDISLSALGARQLTFELQPAGWFKNRGKAAPEFSFTDLQNWKKDVPLSPLRGKWVLVDFWATWCLPCVQEMPRLIEFYETHASQRDRFEIVAVHSPDGKSLAAIRNAYDGLIKRRWDGKALPFPLVFDSTGNTHKHWGVETYPTTLLVDPEGRIVGAATIKDLREKLGLPASKGAAENK